MSENVLQVTFACEDWMLHNCLMPFVIVELTDLEDATVVTLVVVV